MPSICLKSVGRSRGSHPGSATLGAGVTVSGPNRAAHPRRPVLLPSSDTAAIWARPSRVDSATFTHARPPVSLAHLLRTAEVIKPNMLIKLIKLRVGGQVFV